MLETSQESHTLALAPVNAPGELSHRREEYGHLEIHTIIAGSTVHITLDLESFYQVGKVCLEVIDFS
jgi:hypothetical protein